MTLKTIPAAEDKVFDTNDKPVTDFKFDKAVAGVFDNMVSRSVPFYDEIQRMVCELATDFAQPQTSIYDLGCSTGTTFLQLHETVDASVSFIGLDDSESMLDKARAKLAPAAQTRAVEFRCCDIQKNLSVENASVTMMVLTLQFIRPLAREKIIRTIYDGMTKNSAFILVEKLTTDNSMLNRLYIEHYYDYKRRQGYSDLEITRKREALENVLIPYRMEENVAMLKEAGFKHAEDFFRWYNFTALIAIK